MTPSFVSRLGEDGLVEGYEFIDYENIEDPTFYQEYMAVNYPDSLKTHINWDATIEWNEERYPSAEYTEIIESIYLLPEERFMGGKMVDARQLNYVYFWLNRQEGAARKKATCLVRLERYGRRRPGIQLW